MASSSSVLPAFFGCCSLSSIPWREGGAARRLAPSSSSCEDGEPMPRVIADYIAGMTDRFALEEYKKLFDPYERV